MKSSWRLFQPVYYMFGYDCNIQILTHVSSQVSKLAALLKKVLEIIR